MSETKVVICDVCGAESKRDGFKFPAGWMRITAYYRPGIDKNGYAGYCDVDMCPACVQQGVGVTDKLREGSLQEWNMSVINRRED